MLASLLADLSAPQFPSPRASGIGCLDQSGRIAGQERVESEVGRRLTEEFRSRASEQFGTRAIHQLEFLPAIECEDRNVDLLHDLVQEFGRFDGTKALVRRISVS